MTDPRVRRVVDEVSKKLVDDGKLIEAGWYAFRKFVIPANASQTQIDETRFAFFAGAQHLWGSINSIMDADREPTTNDMRRMDAINDELVKFAGEMKLRVEKAGGSA